MMQIAGLTPEDVRALSDEELSLAVGKCHRILQNARAGACSCPAEMPRLFMEAGTARRILNDVILPEYQSRQPQEV